MERERTFRELVREAADPALDPGAAERIADGAWIRAERLRASGPRSSPSLRLVRRAWFPAAAGAAAIVAVVVALRDDGPVFAVEGDPVQVLEDGAWRRATRVPLDTTFWTPPDATAEIRGPDGVHVLPGPGALVRIAGPSSPTHRWRVTILRGDAEVSGASVVVEMSDELEVAKAAGAASMRVAASLGDALRSLPEPGSVRPASPAGAAVTVLDGSARLLHLRSSDFLLVGPGRATACVTPELAGTRGRLAFAAPWGVEAARSLLLGARLLAASERPRDGLALWIAHGRDEPHAVLVDGAARGAVLDQIDLLSAEAAAFRLELAGTISAELTAAEGPVSEFLHRRDGRETRIVVFRDGRARLERTGEAPRAFASLAALREAAPDAAAPFGDRLE